MEHDTFYRAEEGVGRRGEGRGGERVVGGGVLKLRFQSGKEEGEVG
jgi:hypothetical protein